VTRILADDGISIVAMIQREPGEGEEQTDIIMLTHKTRERNIDTAIAGIEALPAVKGRIIRCGSKSCCKRFGKGAAWRIPMPLSSPAKG
jgi:hypothetical protein